MHRLMKAALLLGALCLPASPAIAENFIYLECNHQMKLVSTEIKTGKLLNEEESKEEKVYLKIDPAGNRFMSHKDSQWDQARIAGGKLSATITTGEGDALQVNGDMNIDFEPAGKMISRTTAVAFGIISTVVDMTGDCVAVDESVFKTAKDGRKDG